MFMVTKESKTFLDELLKKQKDIQLLEKKTKKKEEEILLVYF